VKPHFQFSVFVKVLVLSLVVVIATVTSGYEMRAEKANVVDEENAIRAKTPKKSGDYRAYGDPAITVGDVVIDPPTIMALGFSVPILRGDDNYNATAALSYRKLGHKTWSTALPLMRVRPETVSREDPPEGYGLSRPGEQLAGSIFGLAPDTTYEVRIDITDPEGGSRSQTVTARTQRVPRDDPQTPKIISVSNVPELQTAIKNATAGNVITLAKGTYVGRFDVVNRDGTQENPIVIRGQGNATIIDGTGQDFAIYVDSSDYVEVENLRIIGVRGQRHYGLSLSNGIGLTARNLVIEADNGIDASWGRNRDFYICDNQLHGPNAWPNVAVGTNTSVKNFVGISVSGKGHTVCHNTAEEFGSTLFVRMDGATTDNIAIDFHNNDIISSADDGIELDGSMRNVRAWENRITNALMGISFQPIWGGPVYAFRNVIFNTAKAPFKLNNDPSGVVLYHNTAFRYRETDLHGPYDGNAWPQLGVRSYAANTWVMNNILVGSDNSLFLRQEMPLLHMDYNGYWPNGRFGLQVNRQMHFYTDLASFRRETKLETNGVALTRPIFLNTPPDSPDYKRAAPLLDFALHDRSNALDRGIRLPNINDKYTGNAPDLGAMELGVEAPVYGVRPPRAKEHEMGGSAR
jgi:hypothetical protein